MFLCLEAEMRRSCSVVEITLNNLMDESPSFLPDSAARVISEKAPLGLFIYQLSANNPEKGFIQYEYNLTRTSFADRSRFALESSSGIITISSASLDYETIQSPITLYFNARLSGLVSNDFTLRIVVTDVNDNSPMFSQTMYQFNVTENAVVNTPVGLVVATDSDLTSANNNITYYVLNNQFSDVFRINEITGLITVVGITDRETMSKYVMTVCATDNATDSRQTHPSKEQREMCTSVNIQVLDENDVTPSFSQSTYSITLSEKTPVLLPVFTFFASDKDDGDNGRVQYSTIGNFPSSRFSLDSNSGVLTTQGNLDFETATVYVISVRASDSGSPPKFSDAILNVNVLDVNDNSPIFELDLYKFTVLNTATNSTFVGNVNATDADGTALNSNIEYSLFAPACPNLFAIDANTGNIVVASSLSAAGSICRLTVIAKDMINAPNPAERRQDTSFVEITIQNAGNAPPIFSPAFYEVVISEKFPTNQVIFIFEAIDPDDPVAPLSYGFSRNTTVNPDRMNFDISIDGKVTLKSPYIIDSENKSVHMLYVKASDISGLTGNEATLKITVLDVNDNSPTFSQNVYDFSVLENSASGTPIGTVTSNDGDSTSANNQIRYYILGNINGNIFAVDAISGLITVTGNLKFVIW